MASGDSPRGVANIKPPWEATITANHEDLRAVVEEQFPSLAPITRWELIGSGWDNDVWRADERWVFRFPRRRLAIQLLECERAILPGISASLPIPISSPRFFGEASARFPHIFNGYEYLEGRGACVVNPSEAKRAEHAHVLSVFLTALHGAEGDADVISTAPRMSTREDIQHRATWAIGELEKLRASGLIDSNSSLEPTAAQVEAISDGLEPVRDDERCWVHGDLYVRHILLNDQHDISAVIDWGDVSWGDRAYDLGIAFAYLPQSAYEDFAAAQGLEYGSMLWRRALLTSLRHGLALLSYGMDIEDADLVREAARIRARFASEASSFLL